MKKLYDTMLVALIIMFFSIGTTFALDADEKKKAKSNKQVIDFEALTIDGELKKPEGMFIMDRKELKFKRFLNLNDSFINNIIKSIDEF